MADDQAAGGGSPAMDPKTEFRRLVEAAGFENPTRKNGINQAALARHLGANVMSVNRWLMPGTGREPPRSVILFLRAYNRLSPEDRAAVLAD